MLSILDTKWKLVPQIRIPNATLESKTTLLAVDFDLDRMLAA
jgi:hypothetical protein